MTKWLAPLAVLLVAVSISPFARAASITLQTGGAITSAQAFGSDPAINLANINLGDPWQLIMTADPNDYTNPGPVQVLVLKDFTATVSFDSYSFGWDSHNGDIGQLINLGTETEFQLSNPDESLQMQLVLTNPTVFTPTAFFSETFQPGSTMAFGHAYTTFVKGPISPVPEPSSWVLLVSGLGLLGWASQRRRCGLKLEA